jgi:DNA-binding beta-propeller fold protein YncE
MIMMSDCKKDKGPVDYKGFPEEVGKILINKCAVSGCHNTASKDACVGLDLSSWDKLFEGGRNNSSVIPYRPDQSFLLFSVNTFDEIGPKLEPTMPVNREHLSKEEVEIIRDWIAAGAPDKNGYVKWSEDPNRKKVYVVNQGCDFLTVFDAKSKLVMRAIDVGVLPNTEAPHDMYVSPDGKFLYILFYAGNVLQKFRTSDDTKVGELTLSDWSWHSMSISGNSKYALASHLSGDGKVALIDLENMNVIITYQGSGFLVYPHGNTMNYNGSLAYVTAQQGNFIYKMDLTDPMDPDIKEIVLNPGDIPSVTGIYKPYDVEFSPDYSKYYVTCQGTNELRVFKTSNDSLLNVIQTSGVPQVMAFSEKNPYVFVPCMGDTTNPNAQSSVNVINLNTNELITTVNTGNQPRSCAVDDVNNIVWVANRNISGTGWAPHHTTACAGRNGYVTIIDQSTLKLVPNWKCEVSVDPYHVTIKK